MSSAKEPANKSAPSAEDNTTPAKTGESDSKVPDPAIPDRKVSTKTANIPYLAYREYRESQEKLHQDWLKKKEEHDAKVARGEKVGKLEPDPTAPEEVGVLGLLKFLLYVFIIFLLAGKFFTGSFLWEYESKWTNLKTYWPKDGGQRLFSERMLASFDGTDPTKPVYVAIEGLVYDVSTSKATYGPGGSYHSLAGVDAARSFATGCFKEHRTHDTRGLNEQEREGLKHWVNFFANHKKYFKVGRVVHHPIDPQSPIPEHCDPKRREEEKQKNSGTQQNRKQEESSGHQEL